MNDELKWLIERTREQMKGLTEGERIKRYEFLHNELQKQMERARYNELDEKLKATPLSESEREDLENEPDTISYEETIEELVDVYRQEFMKLSIEELESIPAKVIEGHSWAIPYMVAGERDEN